MSSSSRLKMTKMAFDAKTRRGFLGALWASGAGSSFEVAESQRPILPHVRHVLRT
jgi:hypothetical protein